MHLYTCDTLPLDISKIHLHLALPYITVEITILVPFKIRPSSTVSCSLNVQYGCNTLGTSLRVLGKPCVIVCLSNASSSCMVSFSLKQNHFLCLETSFHLAPSQAFSSLRKCSDSYFYIHIKVYQKIFVSIILFLWMMLFHDMDTYYLWLMLMPCGRYKPHFNWGWC